VAFDCGMTCTCSFASAQTDRPAVSSAQERVTDERGENRLMARPPSSKPHWDETAILYEDVLRRRGSAAHRVLAERAAIAHWRRRHEFSARRGHGALRPLAASYDCGHASSWSAPFQRPDVSRDPRSLPGPPQKDAKWAEVD
jgi:hypothetical protein